MTVGAIGKEASAPARAWRSALKSPLTWIAAGVFLLHVVGIAWGLPASDGWDDDGIAPRDFLVGVAETYWPGHFYTYPPVHLLLLTLLTLPVSLVALARAPSLAPQDLVREFIRVPYMTTFALTARVVTLLMSMGIVLALAAFAKEVRGRTASYWVAVACGLNAVFTYYAHTTNLDVPYLFWSSLSLLWFTRAIVRGEPRRLRSAVVFAALAIGTKDQAYAIFLLGVPLGIALWVMLDDWVRAHRRAVFIELGKGCALGATLLLVLDGAVTNPSGFAARLRFLSGPASQNHTQYAASLAGVGLILRDSAAFFTEFYPVVFAALMMAGIYVACARAKDPTRRIAGLLPLLFALSFTLAFNFVARRSDHRFLLPQTIFLSTYAGLAIDALVAALAGGVAWLAYPILSLILGAALFRSMAVDAALLFDPRYEAESWLGAHVRPGDTVETYGNNVYLPHFPETAHVVRVGPEPVTARNPLPDVEEVMDEYEAVDRRRSEWIVVSEGWVWRYLTDGPGSEPGRVASGQVAVWQREASARRFFRDLFQARRGYHLAHLSHWQSSVWPLFRIHASTALEVRIFQRDDVPAGDGGH